MYTNREPEIRGMITIAGTGAQVPAFDLRGSNRVLDQAAIVLRASRAYVINGDLQNGHFGTLGAGGDDVFASWVEAAAGTSSIEQDLVTYGPAEVSAKITLDASHSEASLSTGAIFEVGKTYTMTFDLDGTEDAVIMIDEVGGGTLDAFSVGAARSTKTLAWTATATSIKIYTADDAANNAAEIHLLNVVCAPDTPQDAALTEFTGELQASFDGIRWYYLVQLTEADINIIKSFSGTPFQYARFYVTSYTLDDANDVLTISYLMV